MGKSFLLLVLLILTLAHRPIHVTGKKNISPPIFTAQLIKCQNTISRDSIYIETTLINNSSDTLSCYSMNCAWQTFYRTDSKDYMIEINHCFKNGYIIIKIPPLKNVKTILTLLSVKSIIHSQFEKIRIGYNLIRPKPQNQAYYTLSTNENIIWSDPIELK